MRPDTRLTTVIATGVEGFKPGTVMQMWSAERAQQNETLLPYDITSKVRGRG